MSAQFWLGSLVGGSAYCILLLLVGHITATRRRHDRMSDELSALRRVYYFDTSGITGPVSSATLTVTQPDSTTDFTVESRVYDWGTAADRKPSMGPQ